MYILYGKIEKNKKKSFPNEALAKIDLMQKCIFAMLTFYKVKCSAQHLLPSKQAKEVGFLWKNLFFAE